MSEQDAQGYYNFFCEVFQRPQPTDLPKQIHQLNRDVMAEYQKLATNQLTYMYYRYSQTRLLKKPEPDVARIDPHEPST